MDRGVGRCCLIVAFCGVSLITTFAQTAHAGKLLSRKDPENHTISITAKDADDGEQPEGTKELRCPAWLDEYALFHKQQRGKPDATYLMYGPCDNFQCTGTGDRIKASMSLLRLAALHKKVLLLSWDKHAPLDTFLEPQAVDWRYDSELEAELKDLTSDFDTTAATGSMVEKLNPLMDELIVSGAQADEFQAAKIIRTQAFIHFNRLTGGNNEDSELGPTNLGRCLFRFLYKPSEKLVEKTDAVVHSLYGETPGPYVAWHWRTGGLVGEAILDRAGTTHVEGTSRLHQLLSAAQCAREMAASRSMPALQDKPMLLITDHNIIRQWVASGELANTITRNATVVHIRSKSATPEDILDGWVDVALLARAECLLTSHSGFSLIGLWMGNTDCHTELKDCVRSQRERFEGFDI